LGRLGTATTRVTRPDCIAISTWVPKPFSSVSSSKDEGRMRLPAIRPDPDSSAVASVTMRDMPLV
jgi:hypothetical protein